MQLMRPDSSKVLPRYLHLYLNGFHVSGRTAGMQTASTNIRNIKASEYMEIEVAVPDLQTQKRLVDDIEAKLDSCSALEAEIRRSGTRLSSLRRAVLAAAFSGNLPAAGRAGLEGMAHA
jgi:type I restriction enzyme S subunit